MTSAEKSSNLLAIEKATREAQERDAEVSAERIRRKSGKGRPKGKVAGGRRAAAAEMGVDEGTLRQAESHVSAIERYPFLERWKSRSGAVTAARLIESLPAQEQLAAAEIVRRAERCIGLAIRKGQAEGKIRKKCENGNPAAISSKVSEIGIGSDELSRGPYALTDNVTDAQFEEALEVAKAEKNLSRAARTFWSPTRRWVSPSPGDPALRSATALHHQEAP